MRLTNKQLAIVVDEIYINVSQPIIDRNKEIKESIILPKEPIMRDKVEYDKLMEEADILFEKAQDIKNKAYKISSKYDDVKLNNYKFSSYGDKLITYKLQSYLDHRINQLAKEKYVKYPSRSDIERKVILSESKELGELIDSLIKEYTK